MIKTMIQLDHVVVTFKQGTPWATPALNHLSVKIPTGQFVTVIGSNGAGKSTLLNVISGDIVPDQGQIRIANQEVTHHSTQRRSRQVARVFQNPLNGSCADLTVAENLALAYRRGQARHLIPAVTPQRATYFRDALSTLGLGLENRLGDRMGLLSGGQRQAICLLMATLAPHQVLLLDEHTAALDPKTAADVLRITQQLVSAHQLTTVMVTHSMRQALALGDRTLMLHQGQFVADWTGQNRHQLTPQDLQSYFERLEYADLSVD
jgi:putative tryptophan/tyrosine transport system ATP-binding protein